LDPVRALALLAVNVWLEHAKWSDRPQPALTCQAHTSLKVPRFHPLETAFDAFPHPTKWIEAAGEMNSDTVKAQILGTT